MIGINRPRGHFAVPAETNGQVSSFLYIDDVPFYTSRISGDQSITALELTVIKHMLNTCSPLPLVHPDAARPTPLNPKREKRDDDGRPRREAPTSPRADSLVCDRVAHREGPKSNSGTSSEESILHSLFRMRCASPESKPAAFRPPLEDQPFSASTHGKIQQGSPKVASSAHDLEDLTTKVLVRSRGHPSSCDPSSP